MRLVAKKPLILLPVLLLVAGLALTGCESDTVAPHEELPELEPAEAAQQAAIIAAGVAHAQPQIFFGGKSDKNEYTYTFPGSLPIDGVVYLDFRMGDGDGAPAPANTATWGHLYTDKDAPIDFIIEVVPGSPGHIYLDLNIMASINPAQNTARLLQGSAGTFRSGDYTGSFVLNDLQLRQATFSPEAGSFTIYTHSYTLTVTYDGTHVAVAVIDGVGSWTIDLDDGTITEIDDD